MMAPEALSMMKKTGKYTLLLTVIILTWMAITG